MSSQIRPFHIDGEFRVESVQLTRPATATSGFETEYLALRGVMTQPGLGLENMMQVQRSSSHQLFSFYLSCLIKG